MSAIHPFRIDIPQADLDDLHARLDNTRWPDELPGVGNQFGIPLARMRPLVDHWRNAYDWRAAEAELNSHPQYVTEIDGQRIHFFHIRSDRRDALPLVLTHGWPGSIVEYLDVIGPLSRDFHLVIPSLPGWGFSGPTRERGWNIERVARAWAELMRRLGYERYGAQGGDWGAGVSRALSELDAEHVAAIHVTYMPTLRPPGAEHIDLSPADQERLARTEHRRDNQPGVRVLNGTRPMTPAYGISDSPVGLLAWLLDTMTEWAGPDFAISDDRVLTNAMLYWLTGTAGTAARLHREESQGRPINWHTAQPVGVAVCPDDITLSIRPFVEHTMDVAHWTEFPLGGHFPGLEIPDLLADDIRKFFTSLKS